MTFETSIDKINMCIRAVYVSGRSDLGLRIWPTECSVNTAYGTPKLSYVVIFLVVLSKNCVILSMYYVIILKTRAVLSIYNVDMPTHCLILLKNHFILSQRGVILSKKDVNLSI